MSVVLLALVNVLVPVAPEIALIPVLTTKPPPPPLLVPASPRSARLVKFAFTGTPKCVVLPLSSGRPTTIVMSVSTTVVVTEGTVAVVEAVVFVPVFVTFQGLPVVTHPRNVYNLATI